MTIEPALPLASVPFAVTFIALPPSPFSRKRVPAIPVKLASPRVSPELISRMFVIFRLIIGRFFTSTVSKLIRCSVERVFTSGASPVIVTLSVTVPTSSVYVRLTFCAALSGMPRLS